MNFRSTIEQCIKCGKSFTTVEGTPDWNLCDEHKTHERALCKTHDRYVGKDQFGNWYPTCYLGHVNKEVCDIEVTGDNANNETFFWLHNR